MALQIKRIFNKKLLVCISGASGVLSTKKLIEKSPWPITLIFSKWGKEVYQNECGSIEELMEISEEVCDNNDLSASISSGSVETAGIVICPCSSNTLAKIASGINDTLITRATHCHLKERRNTILCVRESPLTLIDIDNAGKVVRAGAVFMPLSLPFYMLQKVDLSSKNNLDFLMEAFADRILSILGHKNNFTWEDIKNK